MDQERRRCRSYYLLALLGIFSCSILQPREESEVGRERSGEEKEKAGEKKKRWSGRSYLEQTRVEATPRRAATASGFDAERVWSGYDDWEPALAVDPGSNYVYQMTTRYGEPDCVGCASANISFRRSPDGGATWEPDQHIFDSRIGQFDPLLEVSEDGTLFAVFMLSYTPGVMLSRSTDRGMSWSSPVAVGARLRNPWSDKPVLTVSRDGRDVYVAFNTSSSFVASSHDGGLTFGEPVKTNKDRRYWYHYQGAVSPDGSVTFAAVDVSQDFTGDQYINVIRSTDGGRSWVTHRLDSSAEPPECAWAAGCYFGFFGATPGIAVDSSGLLLSAYNVAEVDGGPAKLYTRTSRDGVVWSERLLISPDSEEFTAGFPAVAAGPVPGDFRVSWQDDRNGRNTAWNTWYIATLDGGSHWTDEVRLSDQGSGAPYKSPEGYLFPYGDYYELAVDSAGTVHAIWGEGDSWDGPGGAWYTRGK